VIGLGVVLSFLLPYLTTPRSKAAAVATSTTATTTTMTTTTTTTTSSTASLAAAPSLASPIDVRRQAWQTAIQTVWVPEHNFFLELLALGLKSVKLSFRNIIGVRNYCHLTATTEQQEVARVKAWEIALDAQLAGGDVEVNKRRLALTLLASGTLPDTPARLMLKALHIRILLLAAGQEGLNYLSLYQEFAANAARAKWDAARLLHRLNAKTQGPSEERLPAYLAALLEQECDDVLTYAIGQRAYNLTWNLPTTHHAPAAIDGMDGVVEDAAIRSPLDAVAAWYSSLVLQRALARALAAAGGANNTAPLDVQPDIALAIRTAPIGSTAQIRALVARAVLVEQQRGLSIAASIRALGMDKKDRTASSSYLVNARTSMHSLPDLKMALSYAIAIAHLDRSPPPLDPATARQIITRIEPAPSSLVGFVAAFTLMTKLNAHTVTAASCSSSLEKLAGTLRIWIGSEAGAISGLDTEIKKSVVDSCLAITKRIVGVEDDGYESMAESDADEGC